MLPLGNLALVKDLPKAAWTARQEGMPLSSPLCSSTVGKFLREMAGTGWQYQVVEALDNRAVKVAFHPSGKLSARVTMWKER